MTYEELRNFWLSQGNKLLPEVSEKKLRRIFDTIDADGSDAISQTELVDACRKRPEIAEFFNVPATFSSMSEKKALEVFFCGCDRDGDGMMSWEELREFYMELQVRGGKIIRLDKMNDRMKEEQSAEVEAKDSAAATLSPLAMLQATGKDSAAATLSSLAMPQASASAPHSARSTEEVPPASAKAALQKPAVPAAKRKAAAGYSALSKASPKSSPRTVSPASKKPAIAKKPRPVQKTAG